MTNAWLAEFFQTNNYHEIISKWWVEGEQVKA
jgi:hypothetical protein